MILIKNGRVVDAKSNTDEVLDVVIDGGKIKTIGKVEDDGSYEQVIDADGCVVAPGLIDVHHFIVYILLVTMTLQVSCSSYLILHQGF